MSPLAVIVPQLLLSADELCEGSQVMLPGDPETNGAEAQSPSFHRPFFIMTHFSIEFCVYVFVFFFANGGLQIVSTLAPTKLAVVDWQKITL